MKYNFISNGTIFLLITKYYSGDQIKTNEMGIHTGERRVAHGILVGKREGKTPLEKCRCRWEHNIKMNFQEVA
jgi:hypothetical protein